MNLLLKSDTPLLELFLLEDGIVVKSDSYERGKEMAKDLPALLTSFVNDQGISLAQIKGIGVYAGPGSFTGLRITHAYANALAYALGIPVANADGTQWMHTVDSILKQNILGSVIVPEYGQGAHITQQKK